MSKKNQHEETHVLLPSLQLVMFKSALEAREHVPAMVNTYYDTDNGVGVGVAELAGVSYTETAKGQSPKFAEEQACAKVLTKALAAHGDKVGAFADRIILQDPEREDGEVDDLKVTFVMRYTNTDHTTACRCTLSVDGRTFNDSKKVKRHTGRHPGHEAQAQTVAYAKKKRQ